MLIKIIARPNKDGWWAEVIDFPGCYSHGSTLEELKSNLDEAIALHTEGLANDGNEIAKFPLVSELEYDIKVDVHELFESFPVPVTALAERAGINRSLLAQYKKGRTLSEEQAVKVFKAIKQIGQELTELPV